MKLNSSMLAEANYNKDAKTLELTFKSGKTYKYKGVNEIVFNELIKSDSAGRYFRNNILGHYDTEKEE